TYLTTYMRVLNSAADKNRRKEVVKVKTVNNLADDLRKHYNKYISKAIVNNYL
ncbi:20959_t:CDS:1, partial [Racocetra persica]